MRHLEILIIGSAIGDNKFKQVEFLEPDDFQHYSEYWKIAKQSKGDLITMMRSYPDDIQKRMSDLCNIAISTNLYNNAILLVELRFKRLLNTLLYNLSKSTTNPLESALLGEAKNLVDKHDVFDLSDVLIKYIGYQITPPTKRRVEDFIKYRDRRGQEIKTYQPKL